VTSNMNILGISAYYHDSAAALIGEGGKIIAAAQEERFSRKKHDSSFPTGAIQCCLGQAGLRLSDIDYIVFYDKPLVKFERLVETYLAYAPIGIRSFIASMPIWLKDKLYLKNTLKSELSSLAVCSKKQLPPLLFTEHHQAHAASAFFPSPFKKAAVLCFDGVGEWASTSVWLGEGNQLKAQWQINFPHSLGLLYSAFTYYCGFRVNSGEYKLMGLASYGKNKYVDIILDNIVDLKEDGTFRLNMKYFNYATGLTMTNKKFAALFGGEPRKAESQVTQREMDIAASIQTVTEEIVLRLSRTVHKELGVENLCLAGGVALNCVANGRIQRETPFKQIWIQPAAGDAGGALGAAMSVYYQYCNKVRTKFTDRMQGAYLGNSFHSEEIKEFLNGMEAPFQELSDQDLLPQVAELLAEGKVIGWFQGKMEFGPRSLGNRSILGDSRNQAMQKTMNLKIKYRESFRPFAPAIKEDKLSEWFEQDSPSPYMLLVAPVKKEKRIDMTSEQEQLFGIEKLNIPRSEIPAVTHVDYSARIQSVSSDSNERFYALLDHFDQLTGCPILVNTSFNVRGEPIVCFPEDAYRCFMRTEMDYLVMENIILTKSTQPSWLQNDNWREEFKLD